MAVELLESEGFGRVRLAVIPNASTKVLREFLLANIERGCAVVTDGWQPCRRAVGDDFHIRHPISSSGFQANDLLPAVHRVAALLKRWLPSTHQGSMIGGHLPAYLDEFTFRFNRRRASHRGPVFYRLLQLAVGAPTVTYGHLPGTRGELETQGGASGGSARATRQARNAGTTARRQTVAADAEPRLRPTERGSQMNSPRANSLTGSNRQRFAQ